MGDRFSIVARWDDVWFMNLPPHSKLLFDYLCDNCSDSGFIEINYRLIEVHTGLNKAQIKSALLDCKKNLLSDTKSKIWVKTHLFWQRKLPLHRDIAEHRLIIAQLEKNLPKFNNAQEIQDILDGVIESQDITGKRVSSRFVAPSYEEFSAYFKEVKPDATKDRIDNLYDHYVSCGWKVGKNPMKDWQAAIRKNMNNNHRSNGNVNKNGQPPKSRTQTTMSVVDSIKVQR